MIYEKAKNFDYIIWYVVMLSDGHCRHVDSQMFYEATMSFTSLCRFICNIGSTDIAKQGQASSHFEF